MMNCYVQISNKDYLTYLLYRTISVRSYQLKSLQFISKPGYVDAPFICMLLRNFSLGFSYLLLL